MTITTASLPSMNTSILARTARSIARAPNTQRSLVSRCRSVDDDEDAATALLDEATSKRSLKRARKLLELVHTEESYISDLKSLHNVGMTEYDHCRRQMSDRV